MIAVFFALPEESRDFVARLSDPERRGDPGFPLLCGFMGGRAIGVFHLGMGADCARYRLRRLAETGLACEFETVIAAGFAGGLDPALRAGSLVLDGTDRPLVSGAVLGRIATSGCVLETPSAKAEFFRATGALAVEMENGAVAEFARLHELPFLALRAISDPANEALPVPTRVWFDTERQQPKVGALLAFLCAHPLRIPGFARFVRNVTRARRALTEGLVELLEKI